MTQPAVGIDELLTEFGQRARAALSWPTPEEEARALQESRERVAAEHHTLLDKRGVVACHLCLEERPRTSESEPYYYSSDECKNKGKSWHYHRDWSRTSSETAEST
ncbi:hypothetical protein ACWDFH_12405 [Streptomyces kronopolitis]